MPARVCQDAAGISGFLTVAVSTVKLTVNESFPFLTKESVTGCASKPCSINNKKESKPAIRFKKNNCLSKISEHAEAMKRNAFYIIKNS